LSGRGGPRPFWSRAPIFTTVVHQNTTREHFIGNREIYNE